MSQKTDSSEFTPGFLWQIGVLTILVLGLVLFSDKFSQSEKPSYVQRSPMVLYPWALAGGHTIENGLKAFSGKPSEFPEVKDQAAALAGLLISSVLCPTVFFLEWRRRRISGAATSERPPLRTSSVFYGFCGALTLCVAGAILPIATISEVTHHSLRDAQAVASNKDAVIGEINLIDMDLSQYYILPKELAGGGRSYEGYKLPQGMEKTEEGTYVVTLKRNEVDIRAESVRYPSCWIEMKVDSTGRKSGWTYGGNFR
jgi:hypothetical protein